MCGLLTNVEHYLSKFIVQSTTFCDVFLVSWFQIIHKSIKLPAQNHISCKKRYWRRNSGAEESHDRKCEMLDMQVSCNVNCIA